MATTAVDRTGSNFANGVFIPSIYPKKCLQKFYAESVCNAICNMDYQGDILAFGNAVQIRKRPDVFVNATSENEKISWQDINDEKVTLYINYAFDAAAKIGNIDMHQMDINLQAELVDEISHRLRLAVENTVISTQYASAGTTKTTGAVAAWNTTTNSTLALGEMQAVLSSQIEPCPSTDRWVLIHPQMRTALLNQVGNYASYAGTPEGAMQRGYVTSLHGFTIYESPLVPGAGTAGSPYLCMAGHQSAITLATQFTQFEVDVMLQDYFGKGIRAQNCFGVKTVKPTSLVSFAVQL